MENLSDFLKEFRRRLSNPLIFSFLISWLIVNWKITLGLVLNSREELRANGYNSFFDLIKKESNQWNYLWLPFIFSMLYTFIFPLIRIGVKAFHAWVERWGDEWNLKIARHGIVDMDRYLKLREEVAVQKKELSELLQKENIFKSANLELTKQKKETNAALEDLKAKYNPLYHAQSSDMLAGRWEIRIGDLVSKFVLKNNSLLIDFPIVQKAGLDIQSFACNLFKQEILMVVKPTAANPPYGTDLIFFQLRYDELNYLEGIDNLGRKVEFKII